MLLWTKMGSYLHPAALICRLSCGTSRLTSAPRPCMGMTTMSAVLPSSPPATTSSAAAGTRPSRCGRLAQDSAWELTLGTGGSSDINLRDREGQKYSWQIVLTGSWSLCIIVHITAWYGQSGHPELSCERGGGHGDPGHLGHPGRGWKRFQVIYDMHAGWMRY